MKAQLILRCFKTTRTLFLSAIMLILFISAVFAQSPPIQWQNTIGGTALDNPSSIKQCNDGGYIIGGRSNSSLSGDKTEPLLGGSDYWVVKLNITGDIEWQNTIGGNLSDYLNCMELTSDGGYILGGHSYSGISGDKTEGVWGDYDVWIVKLDGAGNIQWQNTIGGTDADDIYSLQQTSDGGYILGAQSRSPISGDKTEASQGSFDLWVIKLDSSGSILWQNTIGGNDYDFLSSIEETVDGGFIIGSISSSGLSGDKTEASLGEFDYWVVKLNINGTIAWQNVIGSDEDDELIAVRQTSDGGYILGGYSYSGISEDKSEKNIGDSDYWVVKIDASGSVMWENTIGGKFFDDLRDIQQTSDGGYILGGDSNSGISGDKTENKIGDRDYWLIKLYPNGTIQWQETIGGNKNDWLGDVEQTSDGGYIIGGRSLSNISGDKTEGNIGEHDYWAIKLAPEIIPCEVPENLMVNNLTPASAQLSWEAEPTALSYKVRYKIKNTDSWTTINANSNSKTISALSANTKYIWQVKSKCAENPNLTSGWSVKENFTTPPLKLFASLPELPALEIFPNPSSGNATIQFDLPLISMVSIQIFNEHGNKIKTIAHQRLDAGNHSFTINTNQFSKGIYLVQLNSENGIQLQKMIVQ